ncbi:hypothetical protein SESBI_30120 [Sesbania bispinosa]|nr:hypothetical protein SESBI_30120 [Sesbania bispinosa]
MHVPPWRKPDYMLPKWLSPSAARAKQVAAVSEAPSSDSGELELIFGEEKADAVENTVAVAATVFLAVVACKTCRGEGAIRDSCMTDRFVSFGRGFLGFGPGHLCLPTPMVHKLQGRIRSSIKEVHGRWHSLESW